MKIYVFVGAVGFRVLRIPYTSARPTIRRTLGPKYVHGRSEDRYEKYAAKSIFCECYALTYTIV